MKYSDLPPKAKAYVDKMAKKNDKPVEEVIAKFEALMSGRPSSSTCSLS